MEGCVAIYSDLGASFQCLVITSARANSACSDLRPISWKYIVRPRLLTDEAVNKMMCCCCGKPNLCFSFLRRFRSNEPIYLAKNRFQTNLDSKHLFAIVFIPPAFKRGCSAVGERTSHKPMVHGSSPALSYIFSPFGKEFHSNFLCPPSSI